MYLHLVKVLEDNYPEMMKRLYVINGKEHMIKIEIGVKRH